MNLGLSADIEIRVTPNHGRGVFAVRDFAAGELVDTAPVILGSGDRGLVPGWIERFLYDWRAIGGTGADHAVALGYGSLYNSSTHASLTFRAAESNDAIEFHAGRDISAGEQLTINYSSLHGEADSDDNRWFDERRIPYTEK